MDISLSVWEDHLLERKTEGDLKDLLKTMVAFANSVRPGHIAVLLIGEKDDGTIQGVKNPDNIQKEVRKEAERIYPPIVWKSITYDADTKPCVRVEIEYSGETPHFGGSAWVRRGTETIKASDEVFQRLIEIRSAKVRFLQGFIGANVVILPDGFDPKTMTHRWQSRTGQTLLLDVNGFYAVFEVTSANMARKYAEPLEKLMISWDPTNDRPTIIVLQ